MADDKNEKELENEELENVNGGMKVFVKDDDPEELSWWEKFLKLLFKHCRIHNMKRFWLVAFLISLSLLMVSCDCEEVQDLSKYYCKDLVPSQPRQSHSVVVPQYEGISLSFEKDSEVTKELGQSFAMHFVDFLKVDDVYYCYYIAGTQYGAGVGLAKTYDGLTFENCGVVLEPTPDSWDSYMASFPGIWYDDGVFYLVYEGTNAKDNMGTVGVAVSVDGVHFEKKGILLDYNHRTEVNNGTPDLFKHDGIWYLTYHVYDGTTCQIRVAFGADLLKLNDVKKPIVPVTTEYGGTTGRRDVFYSDGLFYMVFETSTEKPYDTASWGHRFAISEDMLDWTVMSNVIPCTTVGMGNDGPSWFVDGSGVYVCYRDVGNTTSRYKIR